MARNVPPTTALTWLIFRVLRIAQREAYFGVFADFTPGTDLGTRHERAMLDRNLYTSELGKRLYLYNIFTLFQYTKPAHALGALIFPHLFASSSSSSQTSSPSSSPDVARCQHGPPDCSGQRRTSIGNCRLQWAAPDLNRGALERTGQRRTATGGLWSGLGNAGPHPGTSRAEWAAPDLSCQKICQKMCQ